MLGQITISVQTFEILAQNHTHRFNRSESLKFSQNFLLRLGIFTKSSSQNHRLCSKVPKFVTKSQKLFNVGTNHNFCSKVRNFGSKSHSKIQLFRITESRICTKIFYEIALKKNFYFKIFK